MTTDHATHRLESESFVRVLVGALANRLAEPASTGDDFVRLASAGETLRRASALLTAAPADVGPVLALYELGLSMCPSPPSSLTDATTVAADLVAYRSDGDEDGDRALALILELDAAVSTVVAAERLGRLAPGTAVALGADLERTLAGLGHRAPHLAQIAEDHWLSVGDDPDLVGAYGWLDVLAEVAPSRVRVDAVVRDASGREARVDEATRILSRRR